MSEVIHLCRRRGCCPVLERDGKKYFIIDGNQKISLGSTHMKSLYKYLKQKYEKTEVW
jgi:hypothetical protein